MPAFPPNAPGVIYISGNQFCRAWVGVNYTNFFLIDSVTGEPIATEWNTAASIDFNLVWTAQSA